MVAELPYGGQAFGLVVVLPAPERPWTISSPPWTTEPGTAG